MIASVSTRLVCSREDLWRELSDPRSLQFVASPILRFEPAEQGGLPAEWRVGPTYLLKLYLLGVIPFGRHTIQLLEIDEDENTIISRESGSVARVWNHTISFRESGPGVVTYTDRIEIDAGWLTPVIWLFAQVFYRHRQRRWKVLLRQKLD